ncbi:spirocyclase AveC family protein [Sinimarinibacterium flocculans]|uniref:spirocyclase AveC family protein n=1 Tax=Sinimarinibacterium flocculans TaxID=985250 RepID=UPI00248F4A14|nr:spirocyclase AveC family protein [Sinimarinibacterium flocculans]
MSDQTITADGYQFGQGKGVEWPIQFFLAAAGIFFLVYQSIGWVGWLADGPVQLTQYRDKDTVSWYLCRVYEGLAILTFVTLGPVVVREAIKARRLTFDLMYCITTISIYWIDPLANFFAPNFLFSQNWVNLADWTAYLPGIQNPDAGRIGEPVLFNGLNYATGWLSFAMMMCAAMRLIERSFPRVNKAGLIATAVGLGMCVDFLLELPCYYFEMWAFPGSPEIGLWANTPHKFPVTELLAGGIMFGLSAGMRYFRDEQGRSWVERGMDHYPEWKRAVLAQLSMIGIFSAAYLLVNAMYCYVALFSAPYQQMTPHILNAVCDAPGYENTVYGPCPGSEGWKLPLPGALAAPPPFNDDRWLNGPTQCENCAPVVIPEQYRHLQE